MCYTVISSNSLSLWNKGKICEITTCHFAQDHPLGTLLLLVLDLCSPDEDILWVRQMKEIRWTFFRKQKIVPFLCSQFLYFLANFNRATRCFLVNSGFFCRLRGFQPLLFRNLQTEFWSLTILHLVKCCDSCLIGFPRLYFAFSKDLFRRFA